MEPVPPKERGAEMEVLIHGLGQALMRQGGAYFLSGPPGIGKTRLIEEVGEKARSLGFKVVVSNCENCADRPRYCFGPMFSQCPPVTDVPDELLPQAVSDRIRELGAEGPTLLVLESLHLAGKEVVAMVIHIARYLPEQPIMLIGSFQDGALLRCNTKEVHPLVDGLRIMGRENTCEMVHVGPLGRDALREVLEGELKGTLEEQLVDRLYGTSDGNPRQALEAARLLVQTKQVVNRGGRWEMSADLILEVPDETLDMTERCLSMLDEEDRMLLEVAAVIGQRFDPKVIAAVEGRPLLGILERLDSIRHDHGLVADDGDRYWFIRGTTRTVLLKDMEECRFRELHRRIGETLERWMVTEGFRDVSDHYYRAEDRGKCVCFSLLAGEKALSDGAWREAMAEFKKVIDATDEGGYEEERLFSIEGMADAEMALGMMEMACGKYEGLLQRSLPPEARTRIMRKRLAASERPSSSTLR